jgi:arylsulfatase
MLSAHDWYRTFAALAGASDKVPADRPIDGIDASKFLLGQSPASGRESILFFGPDGSLMSVKWHNIKAVLRYSEGMDQPIVTPQWPMLFDLASDSGELYNLLATKMDMGWMLGRLPEEHRRVPEHQDRRGIQRVSSGDLPGRELIARPVTATPPGDGLRIRTNPLMKRTR